jgi:hypothetical protein
MERGRGGPVMPVSRKNTKKTPSICAILQKAQRGVDSYAETRYNVNTQCKGEIPMNEIDVIKDIMKQSTPKITLDVLRERLGYKTISGVSDRLSRGKSMKVDTYAQFLDALGYEIVVQPKTARDAREGCYKVGVTE